MREITTQTMPMYPSETVEKATAAAVRRPLSFVFGKRPPNQTKTFKIPPYRGFQGKHLLSEPKTAEPLKKPESPKSEFSADPQIEAEVLKRLKYETVTFKAAIAGLHETIAERNAAIHEQKATLAELHNWFRQRILRQIAERNQDGL